MIGSLAAGLIAAVLGASARAQQRPAILFDRSDPRAAAIERDLGKRLQGVPFDAVDVDPGRLGDPIYKGRIAAGLSAAPFVVAVGDEAASFALDELEDETVYLAGASLVEGRLLSDGRASGMLGYSVEDVLDALPDSWRSGFGVLYAEGYESVLQSIRVAAAKRSIKIIARKVERRRDLAPGARALMTRARAVWVLGDPLLARGAGFDFLIEESLSQGVPLIGSGRWEVERGAAFCSEGAAAGIAGRAARGVLDLLSGRPAGALATGPPGVILFNPKVASRFALRPKEGAWRAVH